MLGDRGHAYYAFDTPGELERMRIESEKKRETFIYNSAVRDKLVNSI